MEAKRDTIDFECFMSRGCGLRDTTLGSRLSGPWLKSGFSHSNLLFIMIPCQLTQKEKISSVNIALTVKKVERGKFFVF